MKYLILGSLLGFAVYSDYRYQKIPNQLTFPIMIFALLMHFIGQGLQGLLFSVEGLIVGMVLLLIPFATGGMGAGDVKLLGAIGAVVGPDGVWWSILYGALAGGIIALTILIRNQKLIPVLQHLWMMVCFKMSRIKTPLNLSITEIKFPYGIAIAIGTVIALWR